MTNNTSKTIQAHPDALIREIDGETIILQSNSEQYFGLDEVGTEMRHQLIEAGDVDGALEKLSHIYDVSPDTLKADLLELTTKLLDSNILILK